MDKNKENIEDIEDMENIEDIPFYRFIYPSIEGIYGKNNILSPLHIGIWTKIRRISRI